MTNSKNYYELLGVPSSADEIILRRAFRKLSKVFHPDTTLLPKNDAEKRFREICEAYEVLNDPNLRKLYDKSIFKPALDKESSNMNVDSNQKDQIIDVRRPLSGGELFALFMLLSVLLGSLILAIGFALIQGGELWIRPSWLLVGLQFYYR